MSVSEFINSLDIRKFFEAINYKPSPEIARHERMLVPISRFIKGEIDLALLLGAHKIMCYEQLIDETKGMLNYTQEGFELAGIEKKKKK